MDRLKNRPIYKINPLDSRRQHVPRLEQAWDEYDVISVPDGGVSDVIQLVTTDNIKVSTETITSKAAAPFDGTFEWKILRDVMIQSSKGRGVITEHYAAQVAGSIIRFVENIEEGTMIVADLSKGVVPGIVTSPCRYSTGSAISNVESTHLFLRDVQWLRTEDDNLYYISNKARTSLFKSEMKPVSKVSDTEILFDLVNLIQFFIKSTNEDELITEQ